MEINISDMIFAAMNFVIMAVILNNIFFKPVMNVLDARSQMVSDMEAESTRLQKTAEAYQAQYKAELTEANRTAQEIIAQATEAGEKSQSVMREEARSRVQDMLAKARYEIEQEKEAMKFELKDEVSTLAILAAGKLLNWPLNTAAHQATVQEFIADYIEQS